MYVPVELTLSWRVVLCCEPDAPADNALVNHVQTKFRQLVTWDDGMFALRCLVCPRFRKDWITANLLGS